jgi:hypothetical protein
MIQYFDNVLPKFYLEDLQNIIFGADITWVHYKETAGGYNGNFSWIHDENTEETELFAYKPSVKEPLFNYDVLIYSVSELLGYKLDLERIKINLMIPTKKSYENGYNRPHVDYTEPGMKSFLLYLNNTDGDTFLFDKIYNNQDPGKMNVIKRVTPKENSAIMFDSNRYHASSIPTMSSRAVINVVFWEPGAKEQYYKNKNAELQVPFAPIPEIFSSTTEIKNYFQRKK